MLLQPGLRPEDPWELNYRQMDLVRPHSSQQEWNGKGSKKTHGHCSFVPTLEHCLALSLDA